MALLPAALSGCALLSPVRAEDPPPKAEAEVNHDGRIDNELEMQALVLSAADEYIAVLGEVGYAILQPKTESPRERWLTQSWLRNGTGAVIDIASGPNPTVAYLDLMVLSALQEAAFERHWIPNVFGAERGGPARARIQSIKAAIWKEAERFLNGDEIGNLRNFIGSWLEKNPDQFVVELVRFKEFVDAQEALGIAGPASPRFLLSDIRETVQAIDKTRLLAERLIWYSSRLPYVLGQQAELTLYRAVDQPELRNLGELRTMVEDLAALARDLPDRVEREKADLKHFVTGLRDDTLREAESAAARAVAGVTAGLHRFIMDERERAIANVFAQVDQRAASALAGLPDAAETLQAAAPELREAVLAAAALAKELTLLMQTAAPALAALSAEGGTVSAAETGALLRDAALAAQSAGELTARANALLISVDERGMIGEANGFGADMIDRIFWRAVWLILILSIMAAATAFAVKRMG